MGGMQAHWGKAEAGREGVTTDEHGVTQIRKTSLAIPKKRKGNMSELHREPAGVRVLTGPY
jgi:hypothetical protein